MKKSKKVKFSIKYKFIIFISLLVGISISSLGYILITMQEKNLTEEMLKRGGFLVRSLSRVALENYSIEEFFPIMIYCHNLIKEEGVKEAFFLNKEGFIIAHSQTEKVNRWPGKRLRWKGWLKNRGLKRAYPRSEEYNRPFFHKASELKENTFGSQLYQDGKYYDIYSPVKYKNKFFGTVHVIFSREVIVKMINESKKKVIYISIIVLVFALFNSLILSSIVVKPVKKLAKGVSIIGTGNLDHKIELKSKDELGYLAGEFNDMTVKIKEAQKVMIEKQKLEQEMSIAASIQQTLLPKIYPKFNNLQFGTFYQATKDVGGDYYDLIKISDNKLGIVVADVSGKGVPGSLIMSMFRSIIRSKISPELDSCETLCRTNSIIYPDIQEGMFITVFYGVFELEKNELDFTIAGHEPLVIYNNETQKLNLYTAEGFPVGITDDMTFRNIIKPTKIKMNKNDLIVQFTDGVTEAMNSERIQFGEERFYDSIKCHGSLLPEKFINTIRQDILDFTAGAPQSDDITIVAVKMIDEGFQKSNEEDDIPVAEPVESY